MELRWETAKANRCKRVSEKEKNRCVRAGYSARSLMNRNRLGEKCVSRPLQQSHICLDAPLLVRQRSKFFSLELRLDYANPRGGGSICSSTGFFVYRSGSGTVGLNFGGVGSQTGRLSPSISFRSIGAEAFELACVLDGSESTLEMILQSPQGRSPLKVSRTAV